MMTTSVTSSTEEFFTSDEKDILQEVINIAFGSATADLAEIIDIYVLLNVPDILIAQLNNLPDLIKKSAGNEPAEMSIVSQKFWGDFSGAGLLVFSSQSARNLISILGDNEDANKPIEHVVEGVLTEVGNILVGACVGKVSELLNTYVTYTPPRVVCNDQIAFESLLNSFDQHQTVIAMKTVFEFRKQNISGFLLIITDQESVPWLRKSINAFAESFGQ